MLTSVRKYHSSAGTVMTNTPLDASFETHTAYLAWLAVPVIQDNARGCRGASQCHPWPVCDALFPVMLETHGCGYLGKKIG